MSADNWRICPKCRIRIEKAEKKKTKTIEESYGKIPMSEFIKLKDNETAPLRETLREDYEVGIFENTFTVKYWAQCEKCNFRFEYRYDQEIK